MSYNELINPITYYDKEDINKEGLIVPVSYDKDVEEKKYIILYILNDENERNNGWKICTGRTETYKFIQSIVEDINIMESKILVETKKKNISTGKEEYCLVNLDKALSVYSFCKSIEGKYSDNFSIDNYLFDYEYETNITEEDRHKIESTEYYDLWKEVMSGSIDESISKNTEDINV